MRRTVFALAACFSFAPPVHAEGPVGIAFVQAPEQSSGVCFADNLNKAFACAKKQCAGVEGVSARDCLRQTWCYPSAWSADLFVQHREGPHWHEVLCGWNSKDDLQAAAKLRCEGSSGEYLIECSIVKSWENGRERDAAYSMRVQ